MPAHTSSDDDEDYHAFRVLPGETHSVIEFLELAFKIAGLDYREFVKTDQMLMRPAEVDLLIGDPSKARKKLTWKNKISFPELVKEMVEKDMENIQQNSS
jgi:GDPmannose 4,6-dehydratase